MLQLQYGDDCVITLIGTNHYFDHTARVVERCIAALQPEIAMLELDIDRFVDLMFDKNITQFGNIQELVYHTPDLERQATANPNYEFALVMENNKARNDDDDADIVLPSNIDSEVKENINRLFEQTRQQQKEERRTFARLKKFLKNRVGKVFSNRKSQKRKPQRSLRLYRAKVTSFIKNGRARLGERWKRHLYNSNALFYALIAELNNLEVCPEFIAAVEASTKYNVSRIVLMDQTNERTLERVLYHRQVFGKNSTRRRSMKEKLKLVGSLVDGSYFEPGFEALKGDREAVKEYLESRNEIDRRDDPAHFQATIVERDLLFAHTIMEELEAQEARNIVVVMGAAHLPGVEKLLTGDTLRNNHGVAYAGMKPITYVR